MAGYERFNNGLMDRVAMEAMNQDWIQRSENTLKQLRRLIETQDMDRLELVRVMRFALAALGQSLAGWMQWINSPEIMSTFTRDELENMAKTIAGMVEQFIEYDVKITEEGMRKGLEKQRAGELGPRFVI
ncbi:MAG: DUF2153 family protein [Candidatus Bathyarchaeia archaeon]|nr:DUF2153 family protein [Candidatus Bathyarchaeota archaeon]